MISKQTGFKRLYYATIYSVKGLRASWQSEAAIRQEAVAFIALIPIAFWLDIPLAQSLILVTSLFLIFIAELLNTAIEALADRVSVEFHELIGKAKDIGSAAVFVAILLALICWGAVLYSRYS